MKADVAANRRGDYFINAGFQRNFIIKFCALAIAGAAVSGLIVYLMSRATVTTMFVNSRLTIKNTADFILPAVLLSSALVVIVVGAVTVLITLFTSHKIAGPLYAIQKNVEEIAQGNLAVRFNLREEDQIKPLAHSLDLMAEAVKSRIVMIDRAMAELDSVLRHSYDDMSEEARDKLAALKRAIGEFRL